MSFSTSTRKEDISMKLRAHNLRNAKNHTRQLELESRQMEDRLKELKFAMIQEKEAREAQGGGFWMSGQEGNIGNYVQDVLKKPAKKSASSNREKSSKKKSVKILKDEPLFVPERTKAPGTTGNIVQRNLVAKEKIKGPKCGQCEQKAAHVNCLECGEDYCAGCFASFHLKGALKKHRSQPIGSNSLRTTLSPRPPPSVRSNPNSAQNSARSQVPPAQHVVNISDSDSHLVVEKTNLVGSSRQESSDYLSGNYNEEESAAAFQEALKAWRTGGTNAVLAMEEKKTSSKQHVTKSPRKEKIDSTEMGTSTQVETSRAIDIKFSNSGLTYAERLLLKKHRRGDRSMLAEAHVTDPDVGMKAVDEHHVDFTQVMEMVTPRGGLPPSLGGALWGEEHKLSFVLRTHREPNDEDTRTDSRLSIIEMDNLPLHQMRGVEHSSSYHVTEGLHNLYSRRTMSPEFQLAREAFVTPPSSAHRTRPSSSGGPGSGGTTSSQDRQNLGKENSPQNSKVPPVKEPITLSMNVLLNRKINHDDNGKSGVQEDTVRHQKRPKSVTKQQPTSRSASVAKKHPWSRTASRAKSRASSRTSMYGEGLLTKGPSDGLQEVARLSGTVTDIPQYTGGLSDFFTAGVKPSTREVQDRILTASGAPKKQGQEKWKISHKLYAMAPRSWQPDSSLGSTVDAHQAEQFLTDPAVQSLQMKTTEAEKALETSQELEQTLSWSWGQDRPNSSGQERSTLQRVRTALRQQAFNQKEDIFHEDPSKKSLSRLYSSVTPRSMSPRAGTPLIGTPRPKSRSGTPRPDSGRPSSRTSLLFSRPVSTSGRQSQAIVMDGEDLADYDDFGAREEQDEADTEALNQLEWELASQDGRITGDGQISRMSLMDEELLEEGDLDIVEDDGPGSGLSSPDRENDYLDHQIRESVLMEDFEEMEERFTQEEVKALN